MLQEERVQVSGSVERITYYNPENGYSVIRLQPDSRSMLLYKYASGRQALLTVVGNLPEVNPGEWLRLSGRWVNHPEYGRQFMAEQCEQALPATTEGIKRYLGSGMIRGVGKVMAERIVDKFGEETLDVIDEDPDRLRDIPGIGPKRIKSIKKAWQEQKAIKDVMVFLQSHGVSTHLAVKIYKQYEDDSLQVVQRTPYRLVQDIYGIGFKTADKIARALGLAHDDPGRIEAGIAYTLNRMAEEGHVYVPQEELEPEAAEILGLEKEKISTVIESLETEDFIKRETITYNIAGNSAAPSAAARETVQNFAPSSPAQTLQEERAVYLTPFYYSEIGVTNRVRRMLEHPTSRLHTLQSKISNFQSPISNLRSPLSHLHSPISLAPQQLDAIHTALAHKVAILTGGPGTGKTTTLRALLDMLDGDGHTYALAAPTGRAAKRLAEATGREAKTIHRLLEFKPGEGFGRYEQNPIDADMIVIDEASMLDLVLANTLLKAIGPDSHLLLVGDVDQLPSVGAGDVLRDLIDSEVAAVVRLQTIFRQAANSLIVQNAHRINQGQMPQTPKDAEDFFLFVKQDPDELVDLLVGIVKNRIPHKFGLHPLDDIQVLSPMYNGSAGVNNLNDRLQAALNPPSSRKPERRLSGRAYRAGDKVMQTVNNYDKNVYNGDIGRITTIDPVQQTMTVSVDGAPVVYDFLEADELTHAYAVSVHKSQGAEYPCVVMPIITQHYMMLQRNLLYTAVTRARRLVVLVGTRRAIAIAVRNNRVAQRHSALDWRLKQ
ncbi:MAG TPA: ATP-dependent RecD-like DNA helicase [Candidatus Sulfomarinibacteraceae bacterium]|nr:ATP-dependent RecD-like DNA helicase [Candidatus Sulfomarinibacteraceae bacterium]